MSADNWTTCPKCSKETRDRYERLYERISIGADLLPPGEFAALREALAECSADVTRKQFDTFREDYEIFGADGGEVHVTYRGRCTKCGLETKLEMAKRFWPEGDDDA